MADGSGMLVSIARRHQPQFLWGGLGLLALGAALLFWGVWSWAQASASAGWPTTTGHVEASRVDWESHQGGTHYFPLVTYSYRVDGERYQYDRLSFEPISSGNERQAQEVVDRYPPGKGVTVHYDPERPQNATLLVGASSVHVLFLAAALASLLLGALLFWASMQVDPPLHAPPP